eukprot:364433-Chlamydomonas_euryale.AAC.5
MAHAGAGKDGWGKRRWIGRAEIDEDTMPGLELGAGHAAMHVLVGSWSHRHVTPPRHTDVTQRLQHMHACMHACSTRHMTA